jgi:hypothetical protein
MSKPNDSVFSSELRNLKALQGPISGKPAAQFEVTIS